MFARITFVLAALTVLVTACDKGSSGRPAPNSVPVAQPPAPAQAPQATPNGSPVPGTPAPGMGKQNPEQIPTQPVKGSIKSSQAVFFNNNGAATDGVIVKQTFLLANFDPKGMPAEHKEVAVTQNGNSGFVSGRVLTHLSDERYISCSPAACINRIASAEDYQRHAESCWFSSFIPGLVARLEFDFDEQGTLRFYATVDDNGSGQIRYGAKNIGYRFDGRLLVVDSFIAVSTIDGGENRALQVSGYTTEGSGSLPFVRGTTYGKPGFNAKSTVSIDFGAVKDGKFASAGSTRAYVGGTISCLTKTERTNFDKVGE